MRRRAKRRRPNPGADPNRMVIQSERQAWDHVARIGVRLRDRDTTLHGSRAAGETLSELSKVMIRQLESGVHMNPGVRRLVEAAQEAHLSGDYREAARLFDRAAAQAKRGKGRGRLEREAAFSRGMDKQRKRTLRNPTLTEQGVTIVPGEKIRTFGGWYRHDIVRLRGKEIGRLQVRRRHKRTEVVTLGPGASAVLGSDINWLLRQAGEPVARNPRRGSSSDLGRPGYHIAYVTLRRGKPQHQYVTGIDRENGRPLFALAPVPEGKMPPESALTWQGAPEVASEAMLRFTYAGGPTSLVLTDRDGRQRPTVLGKIRTNPARGSGRGRDEDYGRARAGDYGTPTYYARGAAEVEAAGAWDIAADLWRRAAEKAHGANRKRYRERQRAAEARAKAGGSSGHAGNPRRSPPGYDKALGGRIRAVEGTLRQNVRRLAHRVSHGLLTADRVPVTGAAAHRLEVALRAAGHPHVAGQWMTYAHRHGIR